MAGWRAAGVPDGERPGLQRSELMPGPQAYSGFSARSGLAHRAGGLRCSAADTVVPAECGTGKGTYRPPAARLLPAWRFVGAGRPLRIPHCLVEGDPARNTVRSAHTVAVPSHPHEWISLHTPNPHDDGWIHPNPSPSHPMSWRLEFPSPTPSNLFPRSSSSLPYSLPLLNPSASRYILEPLSRPIDLGPLARPIWNITSVLLFSVLCLHFSSRVTWRTVAPS